MDRLFDQSYIRPAGGESSDERVFRLPLDAYNTEDAVVVEASLPGVERDSVDIALDGDTLTIRAVVAAPPEEEREYAIRERFYGTLQRSLTLNVPVDAGKAVADFENGVLTLRIPKAEAAKPRKIAIQGK
jgi:HSP20 family protein